MGVGDVLIHDDAIIVEELVIHLFEDRKVGNSKDIQQREAKVTITGMELLVFRNHLDVKALKNLPSVRSLNGKLNSLISISLLQNITKSGKTLLSQNVLVEGQK